VETGIGENHSMLVELPDAKDTIRETTEESDFQKTGEESKAHEKLGLKERIEDKS
jgi:hypothetical protein